ncbi:hypothetical protein [Streptomyces sp. NPDC001680]
MTATTTSTEPRAALCGGCITASHAFTEGLDIYLGYTMDKLFLDGIRKQCDPAQSLAKYREIARASPIPSNGFVPNTRAAKSNWSTQPPQQPSSASTAPP